MRQGIFDMPENATQEQREAVFDRALEEELDEDGCTTKLAVSGGGTVTILTLLRRQELIGQLLTVTEELTKELSEEPTGEGPTDLVHIRQRELPGGDTMTAAILQFKV
jgi:hypothetical protein